MDKDKKKVKESGSHFSSTTSLIPFSCSQQAFGPLSELLREKQRMG